MKTAITALLCIILLSCDSPTESNPVVYGRIASFYTGSFMLSEPIEGKSDLKLEFNYFTEYNGVYKYDASGDMTWNQGVMFRNESIDIFLKCDSVYITVLN